MAYVTEEQIVADIPPPILNDALDDDKDLQADPGLLDQIIANASLAVDSKLGSRYPVPFADPAPAAVQRAAYVFVCENVYGRREIVDAKNPWTKEANTWRDWLEKVAKREINLSFDEKSGLQANWNSPPFIPSRLDSVSEYRDRRP